MATRRFYLVNDSSATVYLSTFHLDCSGIPWLDGLPRCNTLLVPPGAMRCYEPDRRTLDDDAAPGVLAAMAALAGTIALAVLADGAAVPATEDAVRAMVETLGDAAEDATGEEAACLADRLRQAMPGNVESVATVLGTTPQRLGAIMNSLGIGTAVIGGGAMLARLLPEWKFFLTNQTANVWQPRSAVVDLQMTTVIYTVTDAALAPEQTFCEHNGWIRRSSDNLSVWWSSNGIESLPGFRSRLP